MSDLAEYNRVRDAMLLAGDVDGLLAFHRRYRLPMPRNRMVAEIEMHKCRTAVITLPREAREASRKWLLDRGYMPWGDD